MSRRNPFGPSIGPTRESDFHAHFLDCLRDEVDTKGCVMGPEPTVTRRDGLRTYGTVEIVRTTGEGTIVE